jgi:hypothetical protein
MWNLHLKKVPMVPVNSDQIDTLGVVAHQSFSFRTRSNRRFRLPWRLVAARAALQLEILPLRHQIGVLRALVKRPKLTVADRCLWAWLCSVWNGWDRGADSTCLMPIAFTVEIWVEAGSEKLVLAKPLATRICGRLRHGLFPKLFAYPTTKIDCDTSRPGVSCLISIEWGRATVPYGLTS